MNNNKATIILLSGVPASGKSTWGENYFKANSHSYYISRDAVRGFLVDLENEEYFSKETEVFDMWISEICNFALEMNDVVIIADATHISTGSRMKTVNAIKNKMKDVAIDLVFNCVRFDISINVCLERNSHRSGWKKVPDEVIKNMYEKFTFPKESEGFGKVLTIYN